MQCYIDLYIYIYIQGCLPHVALERLAQPFESSQTHIKFTYERYFNWSIQTLLLLSFMVTRPVKSWCITVFFCLFKVIFDFLPWEFTIKPPLFWMSDMLICFMNQGCLCSQVWLCFGSYSDCGRTEAWAMNIKRGQQGRHSNFSWWHTS